MVESLRMESIFNKVPQHRRKIGITQQGLAANVGVSRQTIIALEKGNYVPSVLLAIKISKFFQLPLEELFEIKTLTR